MCQALCLYPGDQTLQVLALIWEILLLDWNKQQAWETSLVGFFEIVAFDTAQMFGEKLCTETGILQAKRDMGNSGIYCGTRVLLESVSEFGWT